MLSIKQIQDMKNKIFRAILFAAMPLLFAACSKEDAADGGDAGSGNAVMRVKAVGSSDGATAMTVAKPVNIYVFDGGGKCVAQNTVVTDDGEADFKLSAGTYSLYAVAGADADNYILPDKSSATPESIVALRDGRKHGDLMCASAEAVVDDEKETEITLEMKRKVLQLVSVCISNVPDDVVDITAAIQPFSENVKINGEYSGEQGREQLTLGKVGSTSTWKNDCKLFLLPSVGKPVITFVFKTRDGKSKAFVTTGDSPLTANYKVEINVDFASVASNTLKCNIKGVEWSGEQKLNFGITESDLVEVPSEDVDVDFGEAPSVGTLYKGCYVLKSEPCGNGTKVTLIGPKNSELKFPDVSQQAISGAVNDELAKLAIEGVDGLRLPTLSELEYVFDNWSEINNAIIGNGLQNLRKQASKYLFKDDEGTIKVFFPENSNSPTSEISSTWTNILRPFATIIFYKQ